MGYRTLYSFLFALSILIACRNSEIRESGQPDVSLKTQAFALFSEGEEAYHHGDHHHYREVIRKILKLTPNNPSQYYRIASASALLGDSEEALAALEKAVDIGAPLVLSADTDSTFQTLYANQKFKSLMKKARNGIKPVSSSETAYILPEKDLIPEGVAFDPVTEDLFISSIYRRKIIRITPSGRISNFTKEKQDHLLSVIGMEVDADRRRLWACSSVDNNNQILDIKTEDQIQSAVYQYDLKSGHLIKKYALTDSSEHFLNDLTIRSDGDVFITDTYSGKIYHIAHENDTIRPFSESETYLFANGITLSDDEKYLFVASYAGIHKINIQSKETKLLLHNDDVTLVNVDGLAFYKNSLIAHQFTVLEGVYQYFLNKDQTRVTHYRIIEKQHPSFDFPTTGELAGDTYYYIANAQLRRFNQDGSIFPDDQLDEVVILKTELLK